MQAKGEMTAPLMTRFERSCSPVATGAQGSAGPFRMGPGNDVGRCIDVVDRRVQYRQRNARIAGRELISGIDDSLTQPAPVGLGILQFADSPGGLQCSGVLL